MKKHNSFKLNNKPAHIGPKKPGQGRKPKHGIPQKGGSGDFWKKWDPLQPKTGKSAKAELNAATNLEFQGLRRQLQSEVSGSDYRRNVEIPKWYGDYQNELAKVRGDSNAAYQAVGNDLNALGKQNASNDAARSKAQEDRAQADAKMRGATYDPSASKGQDAASSARQNLLATIQGTIKGQQASNQAYSSNTIGNAKQAQGEADQREYTNRQNLNSDARALAQKEGDFRVDFLRNLTDTERKYQIEKAAAKVDKFKSRTDRKKAKISAQNNKRTTSTSAANNKRTTSTSAANNKRTTSTSKGNNKRTTNQSNTNNIRTTKTSKQNSIRSGKGKGGKSGKSVK